MSLATRCTSCGTIFRVVQDQLKVSDGWVRCGRCDAVFSAASALFDLEREAPPAWQPPVDVAPSAAPAAPDEPANAVAAVAAVAGVAGAVQTESERRWIESIAGRQPPAAADPPPPSSVAPTDTPPEGAAATVSQAADEIGTGPAVATDLWSARDEPHTIGRWMPADPAPGFVEQAQRVAFWQSRRARAALWAAALLLLVALTLQVAQHFSELAAARLPALRPALAAWCGVTGCSVAAPHHIDDIVVESTALSPTAPKGGLRLAISLRNRAAYPVAMPSIDFTLTDMTGKVIARRALSPRDFSVVATAIQASSELSLQAVLTAGSARVSGYTVEIFYP